MLYRKSPVATMCTQVARGLGMRIVSGEFQPGDNIPIESDLCTAYGVSRSTIREAIKKLASKGLIEVAPKLGTRVLRVTDWNLFDTDVLNWRIYSNFNEEIINEIYEIRLCLEPRACYLTSSGGTSEQLERVRKSLEAIQSNHHHPKLFGDAMAEFHLSILDGAGNNLMMSLGTYIKMIIRALFHYKGRDQVHFARCIAIYQELGAAILGRRGEAAKTLMTELLENSRACAIASSKSKSQRAHV